MRSSSIAAAERNTSAIVEVRVRTEGKKKFAVAAGKYFIAKEKQNFELM